jgi:putative oxidoreductase
MFTFSTLEQFERSAVVQHRALMALRIALGLVFFWFGALKVAGYNPVYDIVAASPMPFLAGHTGTFLLGLLETAIGICLLLNIFRRITHITLFCHMMGTLSVFITGADLMFSPHFPVLTLGGEFVFKNVVLASAGLVVLVCEPRS